MATCATASKTDRSRRSGITVSPRFKLVLNLKTGRALEIAFRADKVIE